jgi:pimeloyl-ACP methyl ester carboxylesterase
MGVATNVIDCRYVNVSGVDLAYQVFGRGERPLLFLHGYSIQSTGIIYADLFNALGSEFTVYAFDMRGHGGSAGVTENWTMAQVADDIAGAVQALGLRGAMHADHSFGGFMGLLTELRHPSTFSALVLLAPSAASGGKATPEEVKSTITNEGKNGAIMRDLYSQMYARSVDDHKIQPLVDSVALMDRSIHQAYFYREYPSVVITDRLAEIKVPVLHLLGAHDNVVAPQEQHLTARSLPLGKEIIFSDEGHMLPLESPQRTAREIANFCEYDI